MPNDPRRHDQDLSDAIAENAASAASVTSAAGSVTAQSIDAQIEADRYLAAKQAAGNAFAAMRPRRMIAPSAIGARIGRGP